MRLRSSSRPAVAFDLRNLTVNQKVYTPVLCNLPTNQPSSHCKGSNRRWNKRTFGSICCLLRRSQGCEKTFALISSAGLR
jgi:hypothetical protein